MKQVGISVFAATWFAFCPVWQIRAAETPASAPDFQEVYDLIRSHLAGISEADLNRTAVTALVSALSPKVKLEAGGNQPLELVGGPLVKASSVYDGTVGYLRISRVEEGLAKAVREAWQSFGTNQLKGLVLDLRYTGGNDYAEAADTADLFISKTRPLLNWGKGMAVSKEKDNAITVPVAVLVNGRTARAAEAMAAVLREAGAALLLGSKTAGQAMIAQEFPLKNGQRLRIATASIQVGDHTLRSPQGVKPDIQVPVNPADERAYYADPYKDLSSTNLLAGDNRNGDDLETTNRLRRPRFNEAELVRERKEGFITEYDPNATALDLEPEKPVVRDPALARAIDVLKGLAVVRSARPSFGR